MVEAGRIGGEEGREGAGGEGAGGEGAGRIGEEEGREGVCPWGELLGRTGKSDMLLVS